MDAIPMNTSNVHDWKRNIKVTVTSNELEKVKEIVQLMPREVRSSFKNTYGCILDLLSIPVEAPALSALSQFWNPSLCCFELPDLDAVPTIEEYVVIMRLPIQEKSGVYLYQGHYVNKENIAKIIGVDSNQLKMEVRGSTQGIRRSLLETHMQTLAQQGDWDFFKRTMALTIYGLVLFPFTPDVVDQAAMDVFFKFETCGMNPIPAMLADTFLSLGVCIQKRGGRLRCCLPMLYVWFMTHVYANSRMGFLPNPLADFHRIQIKCQEAQAWKKEFSQIQSNTFKWVCPWYHGDSVIYSCGDFHNVPLMGPRGCISYTPALVLRQLHWTQTKPQEEQLKVLSFLYQKDKSTLEQERKIKMAWNDVKILGETELGQQRLTSSQEYKDWRKARVGKDSIPKDIPNNLAPAQTPESAQQMEMMKAQMRFLEEKKEAADLKVDILQDQCKKMAREIEALKDECIGAAEITKSRKGKEKISSMHLAKIQELERGLHKLVKEKNQLEREVGKKNRMVERVELEVSQRDKDIWSLRMEVKKEKGMREKLEGQVKHLSTMLTQTEQKATQGWASANQYHDLFVDATEFGKSWREKALEWEEKCGKLTGELSHYIPNFIYRFEQAKKQINKLPPFRLPQEVTEFMDSCERITKGLKRKKMKALT